MKQYKYGGLNISHNGRLWVAWYNNLAIIQDARGLKHVREEIKRRQLAREFPYDKQAVL